MRDPYRDLILSLGREVRERHRIYLDLKYWIYLRDASIGCPQVPSHVDLLERLSRGVADGALICPLEVTGLLELMKQRDPERRLATVRVMDRLSLGVCLTPPRERMMAEILRFLRSRSTPSADLHDVRELVWTKVAFMMGATRPVLPGLSAAESIELDDFFTRRMWRLSLEEILQSANPADPFPAIPTERIAARVNAGNQAHADELHSLRSVYETELRGVFDVNADLLEEAMIHLFESSTGRTPTPEERIATMQSRDLPAFFWNVCRLARLESELPSFHVLATLYARVRWDRQRRFKANDVEDFLHAAAAVPYCDIFLTEQSLAVMLTSGRPSLATEFGLTVAAREHDALRLFTA